MKQPLCFCNSGKKYDHCCQPLINQQEIPSAPEYLMRSRYSAFNFGDVDYLIATTHPTKRQKDDKQVLQQTIKETQWLGLRILNTNHDSKTGIVEFVAFYQDKSVNNGQLHEKSHFVKLDEKWLYVDGELLPPIKIGRNDVCFCASGKKFKKCHGI